MPFHPRLSLHQIIMASESVEAFVGYARESGVAGITINSPSLLLPESAAILAQAAPLRCHAICHPFTPTLDPANRAEDPTEKLQALLPIAASLGVHNIYLITGGRGSLSWEQAADQFAALLAPCLATAEAYGIRLLLETASAQNADIHLCHTLDDTVKLADRAGLDLCLEINACWFESDIVDRIRRLTPRIALVQVSDYVAGDRTSPARAVPGDGMIPLRPILQSVLEAGYDGVFDLELIGPRIAQEGARNAASRGLAYLTQLLHSLGA